VRIHAYAVVHGVNVFESLSFGCLPPLYLIFKAVDGTDLHVLLYRDNMLAFLNTVINFVFHETRKLVRLVEELLVF
jgi:hypothetical protein